MEFLTSLKIDILLIQTVAMILTAILMPRFTVSGPLSALLAVVTLSLVNTHLWDTALFFSVPDSLTVHALTLVIANGIVFWLLVKILPGIDTQGILPPLIAPIIFTIISIGLHEISPKIPWAELFGKTKSIVIDAKEHLKDGEHHVARPTANAIP